MHPYEKATTRRYLYNILKRCRPQGGQRHDLDRWLRNHAATLSLKEEVNFEQASDDSRYREAWERGDYVPSLMRQLESRQDRDAKMRPSRLQKQLITLQGMINLSDLQLDLLATIVRESTSDAISDLIECVPTAFRKFRNNLSPQTASIFTGLHSDRVSAEFASSAPLVTTGLISIDDDGDLSLYDGLKRALLTAGTDQGSLRRAFIGEPEKTELEWQDFEHLGEHRDYLLRMLAGAKAAGEPGVNILLYGPPGTGKTEFSKTLAAKLGYALFEAGREDESRRSYRHDGKSDILVKSQLLAGDDEAMLLVNEADDLLGTENVFSFFGMSGSRSSGAPKMALHRMLETCPVPTFWTTNSPNRLSPSVLRRMTYAIEMRTPPPRVRERVWGRVIKREKLDLPKETIKEFARDFDAAPAIASSAVRAAKFSGGGAADVKRAVESICRLVSDRKREPRATDQAAYDLRLVKANVDPVRLTKRIKKSGRLDFSLCLMGPPGTGKSAYVRYLAEELDLEIMNKRASDLLDMYVGGSEKNIARAFEQAKDEKAFLVFDEADSLISDRGFASRSWEVTQVNEMLTWMERHPLPFACTTNFADRIDRAARRRFTFMTTLEFLDLSQRELAWQSFFGDVSFDGKLPEGLVALDHLTPGDFAVVRKRAQVLDCIEDGEELLEMLLEECRAKPEFKEPMGF